MFGRLYESPRDQLVKYKEVKCFQFKNTTESSSRTIEFVFQLETKCVGLIYNTKTKLSMELSKNDQFLKQPTQNIQ